MEKKNQTRQSTTIEMETRQMMLGDEKKRTCARTLKLIQIFDTKIELTVLLYTFKHYHVRTLMHAFAHTLIFPIFSHVLSWFYYFISFHFL